MNGRARLLSLKFIAVILAALALSAPARALDTAPTTPDLPTSPIIITGYQVNDGQLLYVQLYNNSGNPVDISRHSIKYRSTALANDVQIGGMTGWIEPGMHLVVANESIASQTIEVTFPVPREPVVASGVSIELGSNGVYGPTKQEISAASAQMRRNKTASGNYSTSNTFVKAEGIVLENDLLYYPPPTPDLEIVEVLARSSDCSPDDSSPVCSDYVKLKVGNFDINNADLYRLRVGNKTSSASISSTFSLANATSLGEYLLVNIRDDGQFISLADDGNYVWLEDRYGLRRYDSSIVNYSSASSKTKIGWSWAKQAGEWQWTSTPQPFGSNVITIPQDQPANTDTTQTPCGPGKFRNPETNRCKSLSSTSTSLTPCQPGQYRSPETNRCRSAVLATATLTPCKPGQTRNPATNRCRSATVASAELTPCKPGYERNPATNRCRKSTNGTSSLASAVKAEQVSADGGSFPYGSWILGGIGILAVGYGAYEWRSEIAGLGRRMFAVLGRK